LLFQTTYFLNGHNFIEKELNRRKANLHKSDNASTCGRSVCIFRFVQGVVVEHPTHLESLSEQRLLS